jgi:hypothetical protein
VPIAVTQYTCLTQKEDFGNQRGLGSGSKSKLKFKDRCIAAQPVTELMQKFLLFPGKEMLSS